MADMLHAIHYFGGVENLKGKKVAMTWAYSPSYGKPLSLSLIHIYIPGKCRAFAGGCYILLHGDAALLELADHEIQLGLDVNGLAGGLDGIGHVLQAVAGDHGHHGGVVGDQSLLEIGRASCRERV